MLEDRKGEKGIMWGSRGDEDWARAGDRGDALQRDRPEAVWLM